MKENMSDTQQKVALGVGSAAAATAIWAPISYKWKGILSAIAFGGLFTGSTRFSPLKRVFAGK